MPAWCNVSMALIDNVRHGLRPVFTSNVDATLSGLIKVCWSQNPEVRPSASAILKALEDFFDARQESNMHGCTNSDNCLDESDREISDLDENADESHEQSTNISSSPHSSQPLLVPCTVTELETLKSKLKVVQYKSFQVAAIEALQDGKDVIVVQATGSGKSLCYIASALLSPGKITLVIEPMVAVITNQIQNLKAKGIDAFALGNAAGKKQSGEFS